MRHLSLPSGPLRLVCLAAHPDDIEIAAGATLLGLAERGGVEGNWLTLTGSPERRAEAEEAARAFLPDAKSTFYEFPDGRLPAFWNEVKDTVHAFAAVVPDADLVLAPRMDDAHQDHRLLGTMAPTVWRDALVLHYEIPKWDGDLGRSNCYVPVSAELGQRKVSLLDEHYPRSDRATGGMRRCFLDLCESAEWNAAAVTLRPSRREGSSLAVGDNPALLEPRST